MKLRKPFAAALCAAAAALLLAGTVSTAGCGGGGNDTYSPALGARPSRDGVRVTISPRTATVAAGASQTFAAAVTGTDDTRVLWSVQEEAGGTVTSGGVYTAPAAPGTYHVVVVSVADQTKRDVGTVTVRASAPGGLDGTIQ